MEEQLNKEAKEGWRFAGDAARITDERASSEDWKNIHQEVSLWQRAATWELLLEEKKDQLRLSQENEGKLWMDANVCSILLAHGGMVPRK